MEVREELSKGVWYVPRPGPRRPAPGRAVYSALRDLHTAQTSTQARPAKVTPRLLLAARAQSMCHAMES